MAKAQITWTEDYIEELPREDDHLERKGSRLFEDENKLREELGKQLSAFANSGGGSVILGVDNQGKIDGGIPVLHKGKQSTKQWLEDIIPNLTELEILGIRVLDITGEAQASKIRSGCALYVIEIPDSDRAPHQAVSDRRYYVRLGARSFPAPHRIVEDIRNRARYPVLELSSVELNSVRASDTQLTLALTVRIKNAGKIISNHSCMGIKTDASYLRVPAIHGCEIRAGLESASPLFDLTNTLYPDMSVVFNVTITLNGELQVGHPDVPRSRDFFVDQAPASERTITFTLYAESSPVRSQSFKISELDSNGKIQQAIMTHRHAQSQHRNIRITNNWMS